MQIIINQKEIEKAIKLYLSNQIMVRNLSDVKIDLIATRSGEGVKASIEFTNTEAPTPDTLVREVDDFTPDVSPEEPEEEESQTNKSMFAGLQKVR